MKKKPTAARMVGLVARWSDSGESQASFARRHKIPTWTSWYWCRKLSQERPATAPTTFVPVQMAADLKAPVIDVSLSGGERLPSRWGVDRAGAAILATLCPRC